MSNALDTFKKKQIPRLGGGSQTGKVQSFKNNFETEINLVNGIIKMYRFKEFHFFSFLSLAACEAW